MIYVNDGYLTVDLTLADHEIHSHWTRGQCGLIEILASTRLLTAGGRNVLKIEAVPLALTSIM